MIQDRGAEGLWKLMVGANPMNGWQGPRYPNATSRSQVRSYSCTCSYQLIVPAGSYLLVYPGSCVHTVLH